MIQTLTHVALIEALHQYPEQCDLIHEEMVRRGFNPDEYHSEYEQFLHSYIMEQFGVEEDDDE